MNKKKLLAISIFAIILIIPHFTEAKKESEKESERRILESKLRKYPRHHTRTLNPHFVQCVGDFFSVNNRMPYNFKELVDKNFYNRSDFPTNSIFFFDHNDKKICEYYPDTERLRKLDFAVCIDVRSDKLKNRLK